MLNSSWNCSSDMTAEASISLSAAAVTCADAIVRVWREVSKSTQSLLQLAAGERHRAPCAGEDAVCAACERRPQTRELQERVRQAYQLCKAAVERS